MAGNITVSSSQIVFPTSNQSGTTSTLTEGPFVFPVPSPVVQVNSLTFSGAQFISTTGPANATTCTIIPPLGNAQTLTLKGITGDTGIPLNPAGPIAAFLTFPANSTPVVGLTSGAAISGVVTLIWA